MGGQTFRLAAHSRRAPRQFPVQSFTGNAQFRRNVLPMAFSGSSWPAARTIKRIDG